MSENDNKVSWLLEYLRTLSCEIDTEVLSEYIAGILDDSDLSEEELRSELGALLSAYMSDDLCSSSVTHIVHHFRQVNDLSRSNALSASETADQEGMLRIERRVKELLLKDYETQLQTAPLHNRNSSTTDALRDASETGYQSGSEDEQDKSSASAKFRARQRGVNTKQSSRLNGSTVAVDDGSDGDVNAEDLEAMSGYGRNFCAAGSKSSAQPGTVQNALSTLNPSLFGNSSVPLPPVTSSISPLSHTPAPRPSEKTRLEPSESAHLVRRRLEATWKAQSDLLPRTEKKKKLPAPSKHMAKVAAKAESKHVDRDQQRGFARAQRDEMDAFLVSDSDSVSDCSEDSRNMAHVNQNAKKTASDIITQHCVNDCSVWTAHQTHVEPRNSQNPVLKH
ncbi:unnamed protein product [Dicrocoelium dendriticum]|nr:unnamed protein product [Dicrocoelium dendriticum]